VRLDVRAQRLGVAELVRALDAVVPALRLARHAQRRGVRLAREARDREARPVEACAAASRDAREPERLDTQERIDRPFGGEAVELRAGVARSGVLGERSAERAW